MTQDLKQTKKPAQPEPAVPTEKETLEIFSRALAIIAEFYPHKFHTLYGKLDAYNKVAFETLKSRTAALERMCIAAMARQVLAGRGKSHATRSMLFAYRDYMEAFNFGGSPFGREIYQAILKDLEQ
ncbi:MAG: hypothetical protein INF44_02615 [Thalassospira sp.]|jgi:hypothetical protein|nr:hypothetical protein [Thalassospira sp.]